MNKEQYVRTRLTTSHFSDEDFIVTSQNLDKFEDDILGGGANGTQRFSPKPDALRSDS